MAANNSRYAKKSLLINPLSAFHDIDQVWALDSSATKKFASIPALADLAANEESPEKFQQWLRDGRIYLAHDGDRAVGFTAAHEVDGVLYLDEISVHADHQGIGVGAQLLETVFEWAADIGRANGSSVGRVSLITYADVPWNGPWYRKYGFEEVDASAIGPWHVHKMTVDPEERSLVRPGYRRCCMLREKEAP